MSATAVGIEHTGREALVTVEIAAPPVIAPGADAADARAVPPYPSPLTWPGHVFDGVTGRALHHPEP